jgi:hypothetical protein
LADDTKERKWAEAQFKKEERATEGAKAMSEYKAEREAERAKTERLKALRLAKEASGKIAKRTAPTKRRLSATWRRLKKAQKMPRTDINEEEFSACARYGLMLAEQNEDDAIRANLLKLVRTWLAAAKEIEKAANNVLVEIAARPWHTNALSSSFGLV